MTLWIVVLILSLAVLVLLCRRCEGFSSGIETPGYYIEKPTLDPLERVLTHTLRRDVNDVEP